MTPISIRPAVPGDAPTIHRLIVELARYERAEHEVLAGVADIESSLFAPDATAHALLGETGGRAVAYAVYFFSYSTWRGRNGLFLEDLYVSPDARDRGAGRTMLAHLASIAVDRDCARFEWNVLDWNAPAIGFYESLGARPQDEWIGYRLEGEALARLAAGGGPEDAAGPSAVAGTSDAP